jgi:hypothetical protein
LALAIPIRQLIFTKCNFFLDTVFVGFYTFVNCKVSLAGSMSTRQRENRKNGNQESSSKEASEEGSQKSSKEEVSSQRNRQHNRGTPKASPEVFLGTAESLVFMRLRQPSPLAGKLPVMAMRRVAISVGGEIPTTDCSRFRWQRVPPGAPVAAPAEGSRAGHILTKVVFRHDTFRGPVTQ